MIIHHVSTAAKYPSPQIGRFCKKKRKKILGASDWFTTYNTEGRFPLMEGGINIIT